MSVENGIPGIFFWKLFFFVSLSSLLCLLIRLNVICQASFGLVWKSVFWNLLVNSNCHLHLALHLALRRFHLAILSGSWESEVHHFMKVFSASLFADIRSMRVCSEVVNQSGFDSMGCSATSFVASTSSSSKVFATDWGLNSGWSQRFSLGICLAVSKGRVVNFGYRAGF